MALLSSQEKMAPLDLSGLTMESVMTAVPVTVDEDESLISACRLLKEKKIRHLPVVHRGKLTGILSERDTRLVSLMPDIGKMVVADIMTKRPTTVPLTAPVLETLGNMAVSKQGSVVVTGISGEVCGIFTTQDALSLLIGERGLNLPAPTAYPLNEEDEEECLWD